MLSGGQLHLHTKGSTSGATFSFLHLYHLRRQIWHNKLIWGGECLAPTTPLSAKEARRHILFRIHAEYSQLWRRLTTVFIRTGSHSVRGVTIHIRVRGVRFVEATSLMLEEKLRYKSAAFSAVQKHAAGRWRCFTLYGYLLAIASSYITAIQQVSVSCVCGKSDWTDINSLLWTAVL